eukprot:g31093.t1
MERALAPPEEHFVLWGLLCKQFAQLLTERDGWGCEKLVISRQVPPDVLRRLCLLNGFTDLQAPCLTDQTLPAVLSLPLTSLSLARATVTDNALAQLPCTITHLDLSQTAVTDKGLAHLAKLTSLSHLCLRLCSRLSGEGLSHLNHALRHLDLQLCRGLQTLQPLRKLTALQYLNLSLNRQFDDSHCAILQHLTSLRHLGLSSLSSTKISDAMLALLNEAAFPLESLELAGCQALTDRGLQQLAGMSNLTSLNLEMCSRLTNVDSLLTLPLTSLRLHACSAIPPEKLAKLSELLRTPRLTHLQLSSTNLNDQVLNKLCQSWSHAVSLDVSGCTEITDRSIRSLERLSSLQELCLQELPHLTDAGLYQLCVAVTERRLPALRVVKLGNDTRAVGVSLEAVARLRRVVPEIDFYQHYNVI